MEIAFLIIVTLIAIAILVGLFIPIATILLSVLPEKWKKYNIITKLRNLLNIDQESKNETIELANSKNENTEEVTQIDKEVLPKETAITRVRIIKDLSELPKEIFEPVVADSMIQYDSHDKVNSRSEGGAASTDLLRLYSSKNFYYSTKGINKRKVRRKKRYLVWRLVKSILKIIFRIQVQKSNTSIAKR